MNKIPQSLIVQKISEKSVMKLDVYDKTYETFQELKSIAKEIAEDTKKKISKINSKIVVEYNDTGEFEAQLKFAGDMLFLTMHTNVFEFPKDHELMKTSYIKEDKTRSYCGIINMYNFLADSFKYNRVNDVGYLIGRTFINKDYHYMVEGKRQMGLLYNNFIKETINRDALKNILISAILYCIEFDLLTPPYETVQEISVMEMNDNSANLSLKTGKRLGFKFQIDSNDIK
ncbi:MAG: hypothetical protein HXX09_12285 [Bacteroidetes bacterium]|nr:hypothetical protein [Bacteroidota bacterium]